MVKRKISITVDESVFSDFQEYCKSNGMKVSSRVELMMRDSLRNGTLKEFIEK